MNSYELDPRGRIVSVSAGWQELAQEHERNVLGTTGDQLVHPDDVRSVAAHCMFAWAECRPIVVRVRLSIAGRWIWVRSVNLPRMRSDGTLAGYRGHIEPVFLPVPNRSRES